MKINKGQPRVTEYCLFFAGRILQETLMSLKLKDKDKLTIVDNMAYSQVLLNRP